ncbi:restriction endonuclease subunit S [Propionibacterium freudenreichii]|uniref:restriction endonuclease subunit S n=1 Tax=Propionibacterium freudenreichii TaxID=1744 RepID=UPI0025507E30|nr:restriction endonuclease subunit S [Propionibacterium freudenreichii]MDK9354238.1 restriction endonuclease subunit S [Propionibacterium freudenreichii]
MSQIEELIERLCPDGVRAIPLGEIVKNLDSKRRPVTRGNRRNGPFPYYGANGIQDYVHDYLFDGTFLLLGEDGSVIRPNGSPVLNWATGKIWVNNHAHVLQPASHSVDLRFLYYFLTTVKIGSFITGGTQPKLNQRNMNGIPVMVPPLEVQHEIVKILDTFTDLKSELEAELESRRLQYQLCQEKLLTPASDTTLSALGDISSIKTGGTVSKKFIRNNPGPFPVINSGKSPLGYVNAFNSEDDPIGITSRGAGVGSITWCPGRYFRGNLNYSVTIKSSELVNTRFLYHSLVHLQPKIHELSTFQGIPALNKANLQKLRIPLPSLELQERIVARLDTFDALVNDLSSGLPAELNARHAQYEYYRDKLLTFKELKS